MSQQKMVSVSVACAVGALLLSAIAYMVHDIYQARSAPSKSDIGLPFHEPAQQARRARGPQELRIVAAEVPWTRSAAAPEPAIIYPASIPFVHRTYTPRVYIYSAAVPPLPVKRDLNRPDPIELEIARLPWREVGQLTPVMLDAASVPRLPVRRFLTDPDPATVEPADVPWARGGATPRPIFIAEAALPSDLKKTPKSPK